MFGRRNLPLTNEAGPLSTGPNVFSLRALSQAG